MIKTIKTTKKMRLDELIKHVWDNEIYESTYFSENGGEVRFNHVGKLSTVDSFISRVSGFSIEVEEPITKVTEFGHLIEIDTFGNVYYYRDITIGKVKDLDSKLFYTLIDGRLELVWEVDS